MFFAVWVLSMSHNAQLFSTLSCCFGFRFHELTACNHNKLLFLLFQNKHNKSGSRTFTMSELQHHTKQAENSRPHTSPLTYMSSRLSASYMCVWYMKHVLGRLHEVLHLARGLLNGSVSKLKPSFVGMSHYVSYFLSYKVQSKLQFHVLSAHSLLSAGNSLSGILPSTAQALPWKWITAQTFASDYFLQW